MRSERATLSVEGREEAGINEPFADWIARGSDAIQDLIDRDPATYLLIMAAIFNGAEVQERH
jgi:hypothetical protein